jgi:hypothetical protein
VATDLTELVRNAYRAIGLGVGDAMLRLFGQGEGRSPAWSVVDVTSGQAGRSRPVAADDLFGSIPPHWEVTRVEPATVRVEDRHVIVTGHILCRPRGVRSFDLVKVPFAHVWTLEGEEAQRVFSYLDGVELRRAGG